MIFLMFSLWLCFGRAFDHFTHAYFVRGQVCFNIINHFTTDITYLICTPYTEVREFPDYRPDGLSSS